MTVIESATGDPELTIKPASTPGLTWLEVDHNGHTLGINVPTADLAAALGLPTREELDRKQAAWENECGNLEMTQRDRDVLRAELDELNSNPWKARCQEARNELDEANATIARVRDVIAARRGYLSDRIRAALDPRPAAKQVILTADMAGVQVNGYDFTNGVLTTLPTADADRLISAGLAKEADQ